MLQGSGRGRSHVAGRMRDSGRSISLMDTLLNKDVGSLGFLDYMICLLSCILVLCDLGLPQSSFW